MKKQIVHYAVQFMLYCLESPKIRTFLLTTFLRGCDFRKIIEKLKKKDA